MRKELKGIAGKAGAQTVNSSLAWPALSGLVMTALEAALLTAKARFEGEPRPLRAWARRPAHRLRRKRAKR